MVGEASAMRRNGWRRGRYDVAKSRRTHARLGRRIGERNREQANVRNRPRLREGSMTISRKRSAGSPPLKDRLGGVVGRSHAIPWGGAEQSRLPHPPPAV